MTTWPRLGRTPATLPAAMTASAPAATVLPNVTLQPNVAPPLDKSINEKPVTEKAVDRILSDKPVPGKNRVGKDPRIGRRARAERRHAAVAVGAVGRRRAHRSGARQPSRGAESVAARGFAARRGRAAARIAEAPMVPPPSAPRGRPWSRHARSLRRRPSRPPRFRRRATRNTSSACSPWTTAR